MSGGGRPQSGKMGSRLDKGLGVSDRELEGLERQLADKVAELEELRARGQTAGTAAERAERELAELEMRLPKAKIEVRLVLCRV
jgi:chromosome segregation ATPase